MEGANRIVGYKPDPRTTAFDDFRTKRNMPGENPLSPSAGEGRGEGELPRMRLTCTFTHPSVPSRRWRGSVLP